MFPASARLTYLYDRHLVLVLVHFASLLTDCFCCLTFPITPVPHRHAFPLSAPRFPTSRPVP